MARRPEDVQIQVVMSEEMRRDLGKAALTHQDEVERDRLMSRGPMLGYIAKWFLSRPREEQLEVIREGKRLFEGGGPAPAAEPMRIVALRGKRPYSPGQPDGQPSDVDLPNQPTGVKARVKRGR